jgi:hypothetical protein
MEGIFFRRCERMEGNLANVADLHGMPHRGALVIIEHGSYEYQRWQRGEGRFFVAIKMVCSFWEQDLARLDVTDHQLPIDFTPVHLTIFSPDTPIHLT